MKTFIVVNCNVLNGLNKISTALKNTFKINRFTFKFNYSIASTGIHYNDEILNRIDWIVWIDDVGSKFPSSSWSDLLSRRVSTIWWRTHYHGNIILVSGNQKYPMSQTTWTMSQTTWTTSPHMAYFTMSWKIKVFTPMEVNFPTHPLRGAIYCLDVF